ncbi:MAG: 2OG-Fe(II) oxygenase [Gammaproteobacteria bacterium]|nr:2OG-Fe(II) oxygenase [Gammaproteobacteria bacterium]
MTGFEIDYARDQKRLEEILLAIDRPGDFHVHGRTFAPMPRLDVADVGVLAFPVSGLQIRALIEVAEQAPYGKGTQTLVDRSVRDCWQIDASRFHIDGGGWPETFEGILEAVTAGLGCPSGSLIAEPYKLLIYETGGFFAAHRDTEKADGMVGTLSISLPTEGAGGELVVRHRDREVSLDMNASDPSELAYAAFYADCAHETRPVREGCRLSLVFNLRLRPGDRKTPRHAPDHSDQIQNLTEQLIRWRDDESGPDKLVWLLEHDYSEAGLSWDLLKNADSALAGVLKKAADQADCEIHAAILHIEEEGSPDYDSISHYGDWHDDDFEGAEIDEIFDAHHWLDTWNGPDSTQPDLGKIPLRPEETLPVGALADAEPDEQWINEATGNAGATVERAYRHAALVLWPRCRALQVMAGASIDTAVAWVAQQLGRKGADAGELVNQLIDLWNSVSQDRREPEQAPMLDLLAAHGDDAPALRFLSEVVLSRYDGTENKSLLPVLRLIGAEAGGEFLAELVEAQMPRRANAILALLLKAGRLRHFKWRTTLRKGIAAALAALPEALRPRPNDRMFVWQPAPPETIDQDGLANLFALAWRCGLLPEAEAATAAVAAHPKVATPQRHLPAALDALSSEKGISGSAAYLALWRRAAESLLARSAMPPEAPADWVVAAGISCDCELCDHLKAFCADPVAEVRRFPVRQDLRSHLRHQITDNRLDMDYITERRGRPYSLVCTKNRASHERRRKEYAEDVSWMQALIRLAPEGESAEAVATELRQLEASSR